MPIAASLRRFRAGIRDCLPAALAVLAYGLVYGVLAHQRGLAPLEVLAMSGLVFSGTAQFVVLDLWTSPLPLAEILVSAAIVSLRYLLICASCQPLFESIPLRRALAAMFLVSDENWAVTMAQPAERGGAAHL